MNIKTAKQVRAAKKLIARADAAERAGIPMTDENLKKLGYVRATGGGWELPVAPAVMKMIASQQLKADIRGLSPKQAALVKRLSAKIASETYDPSLAEMRGLPFSVRCQIIAAAARAAAKKNA